MSLCLLIACSSQSLAPKPPSDSDKFSQTLEQFINLNQPNAEMGMVVQSMQDGKILYSRNAEKLFTPASNMKLYTAAAALTYLGPSFKFKTQLLTNGTVENGILKGDIYLKFSGNPDLTLQQIDNLITQMQWQGITQINGNFYIDNTQFDQNNYGPGWMWDDLPWCFAAPINAIMINHNCFNINIFPNKALGNSAILIPLYQDQAVESNLLSLTNQIATSNSQSSCLININGNKNNQFQLQGCIPLQAKPKNLAFSMMNIDLYAQSLIKNLLNKHHIFLNGKISIAQAQANLNLLAIDYSKPLSLLMNDMLKKSDNQIADMVFKTLGSVFFKKNATWEDGSKALQFILAKKMLINFSSAKTSSAKIVDGSGGSRYNLVTPMQTLQLLNFIYHDFNLSPEFISALPIAGVDGTLVTRMQQPEIKSKVRAKTGTMTGVSALSGYIQTQHHGIYAFVIFINNSLASDENLKHFEDELCKIMVMNA